MITGKTWCGTFPFQIYCNDDNNNNNNNNNIIIINNNNDNNIERLNYKSIFKST